MVKPGEERERIPQQHEHGTDVVVLVTLRVLPHYDTCSRASCRFLLLVVCRQGIMPFLMGCVDQPATSDQFD